MEYQQEVRRDSSSQKQKNNNVFPEYTKIPPQAGDTEEAVLGACMLEEGVFDEIAPILSSEIFYKEAHRSIFHAMEKLSAERKPIDIITVSEQLVKSGELEAVGGRYYITMLTSRIASTTNTKKHAYIIYEKYILRETIRRCSELINFSYENDFDGMTTFYSESTKVIDELLAGKHTDRNMLQVMTDHAMEMDERIKRNKAGEMTGIPTGLTLLNQLTNGWKPGELIVLAARPSMGKTAVALNLFTKTAAEFQKNVLFFSIEMDEISLADRLICSYGGISPDNLKNGRLSDQELSHYQNVSGQLQQLPISIDDSARADLTHISAISRTKRRKGTCDMIVIDYLQLIENPGKDKYFKNREREVAELSRGLKLLAKELQIPVILLAQLSRAVENRGDKRPTLADLRESGAIEQDADMVIFPFRPEYYGIMEDDAGNDLKGIMILGISKNRNGQIGDVYSKYSSDLTQITEY